MSTLGCFPTSLGMQALLRLSGVIGVTMSIMYISTCVCGFPVSLGFERRCVRGSRYRGVGRYRVYMCVCVCTGAVNRAVTCASVGALVHTGRRTSRTSAHSPALSAITGRQGKARSGTGEFEPPATPSLLVHDLGGPA